MRRKTNKYDLSGSYGILWLTNTNNEVYFDLCHAETILQYTWSEDKKGYPRAVIDGKRLRMHVFLGYKGYDHIDRNKKNNQVANFRQCTSQENSWNHTKRTGCSSQYIGVKKRNNRWEAGITVNNTYHYLGLFITEEQALIARLRAEKEYYGVFAPQQDLFSQYNI